MSDTTLRTIIILAAVCYASAFVLYLLKKGKGYLPF